MSSSEALNVYCQVCSITICRAGDQWHSLVRCSVLWICFRNPLTLYNQRRISPSASTGLLTLPLLEIGGKRVELAPVQSLACGKVLVFLAKNSEPGITCGFHSPFICSPDVHRVLLNFSPCAVGVLKCYFQITQGKMLESWELKLLFLSSAASGNFIIVFSTSSTSRRHMTLSSLCHSVSSSFVRLFLL